MLYNGLGRYEAALAGAQRACEYEDLGIFAWSLAELVEAGARSGAYEEAATARRRSTERLAKPTPPPGSDTGEGRGNRRRKSA